MSDYLKIIELLCELKKSAKLRRTIQGIKIYEYYIDNLALNNNVDEYEIKLSGLIKHLNGIEAHGYYTHEEYLIVQSIRECAKRIQ